MLQLLLLAPKKTQERKPPEYHEPQECAAEQDSLLQQLCFLRLEAYLCLGTV